MLSSVNNYVSNQAQNLVLASKTSSGSKDFATQFKSALKSEDSKKLYTACQDLESVFVNTVIKTMRQSIQKSSLIGDSFAQETYQSMLDEEYSKQISQTKSLGIADMLYKQLSEQISDEVGEINNTLAGQSGSDGKSDLTNVTATSTNGNTALSTNIAKTNIVENTRPVYEMSGTTAATETSIGDDVETANNLKAPEFRQLYEPKLSDFNGDWSAFEKADNKYRMSMLDPNNLPGWVNSDGNKYAPINIQSDPKLLGTNGNDYLGTDYIVNSLGNIDRIDHTYSGDVITFIPNLGGWKKITSGATAPGVGDVYYRQTSAYGFINRYNRENNIGTKPSWYDENAQSNWLKSALSSVNNGGAITAQNTSNTTSISTENTNNSSYDPDYGDGWES